VVFNQDRFEDSKWFSSRIGCCESDANFSVIHKRWFHHQNNWLPTIEFPISLTTIIITVSEPRSLGSFPSKEQLWALPWQPWRQRQRLNPDSTPKYTFHVDGIMGFLFFVVVRHTITNSMTANVTKAYYMPWLHSLSLNFWLCVKKINRYRPILCARLFLN
jgi:hypothetical protein